MVESVQNSDRAYLNRGSSETFEVEGRMRWKGRAECTGKKENDKILVHKSGENKSFGQAKC
jgi:hypothetical protein